jgi:hypothetical protein
MPQPHDPDALGAARVIIPNDENSVVLAVDRVGNITGCLFSSVFSNSSLTSWGEIILLGNNGRVIGTETGNWGTITGVTGNGITNDIGKTGGT